MALINCKECNTEYSDKAEICTKCGCPTELNTQKSTKEKIKCKVKIKGNEIFYFEKESIGMSPIAFIASLTLLYNAKSELDFNVGFIILFFSSLILIRTFLHNKKMEKALKNNSIIYEYLKKTIPIIEEIKHYHTNMGLISSKELTYDGALFSIYMQAYNKNANAIILKDNNISSKVDGYIKTSGKNVQGRTTSTDVFHLTAILVKY